MTSHDDRPGTAGGDIDDSLDEVTIYGQVPPVHDQRWAAWRLSEFQQRRRRRRRQTTVFFLALILTLCLGGYASAVALGVASWPWQSTPPALTCPTGAVTPLPPAKITVNVLNDTDQQGLATRIGGELQSAARGFSLGTVGNDPSSSPMAAPVEVHTGLAGLPAAKTVQAQAEGAVVVLDHRRDASVDLVLGNGFKELRDAAAASQVTPGPLTACQVAGG